SGGVAPAGTRVRRRRSDATSRTAKTSPATPAARGVRSSCRGWARGPGVSGGGSWLIEDHRRTPIRRRRAAKSSNLGEVTAVDERLGCGARLGTAREEAGMGCLFALLAGFAPRIALLLVWIFTNLV